MVHFPVAHLVSLLAFASAAVVILDSSNFDEIVLHSDKPALVLFDSSGRGWYGRAAYEQVGEAFSHASDRVTIARVDTWKCKDLGQRICGDCFGSGRDDHSYTDANGLPLPMILWFDGETQETYPVHNGYNVKKMVQWVTDKTGLAENKEALSAVEMLTDYTLDELIGGDKHVLVLFRAPWDGHSRPVLLEWEKVATDFSEEQNIVIGIVELDTARYLEPEKHIHIGSFPTIRFFPKGSREAVPYNGNRNADAIVEFLNENVGTQQLASGGHQSTQILTEDSLGHFIGGDKHVFLLIRAPWDTTNKLLTPKWEHLAAEFSEEPDIAVAKMELHTESWLEAAEGYHVYGFPTILFFPKGSTKPEEYNGKRSAQAFAEYLNKRCGTQRQVVDVGSEAHAAFRRADSHIELAAVRVYQEAELEEGLHEEL